MPSEFETRFKANAADRIFDRMARPSSQYAPPKGTVVTGIKVMLTQITEQMETKEGRKIAVRECDLSVRESEVSQPVVEGRFLVDNESWQVVERPELRNGIWKMKSQWSSDQRFNVVRGEK
jgi:hypothetical protein